MSNRNKLIEEFEAAVENIRKDMKSLTRIIDVREKDLEYFWQNESENWDEIERVSREKKVYESELKKLQGLAFSGADFEQETYLLKEDQA